MGIGALVTMDLAAEAEQKAIAIEQTRHNMKMAKWDAATKAGDKLMG